MSFVGYYKDGQPKFRGINKDGSLSKKSSQRGRSINQKRLDNFISNEISRNIINPSVAKASKYLNPWINGTKRVLKTGLHVAEDIGGEAAGVLGDLAGSIFDD